MSVRKAAGRDFNPFQSLLGAVFQISDTTRAAGLGFPSKSRLTCKLPWGGYPKSLHSLNMKNGRSDTPLS